MGRRCPACLMLAVFLAGAGPAFGGQAKEKSLYDRLGGTDIVDRR